MAVKYVFVTGGVVSGLGKGITAASLGRLLKARGYQVTMQKFDPYINIDPGTMNPIQHGEVFVTDDGTETDLDLGHYERFIDESLDKNSNVTTGKVYWSVLQKERHGDFGGGTVQVIPHITNEIKSRFYRAKSQDEEKIAIIEVGGTVGDIESQPFLESIRQFQHDVGRENAILIHVTLIPYLGASGEMKTKPTQASVKELQGMGIQPDIIVCRTERPLEPGIKDKIALFCNVPTDHVMQNLDVETLYEAMIQNGYRVSKATVYNTIDLLLEANLVRKHQFGSNLAQYERVYNANHHHLICMKCGKVREVKDLDLMSNLNTRKFNKFNTSYYTLYVYGICSRCSNKNKKDKIEKK